MKNPSKSKHGLDFTIGFHQKGFTSAEEILNGKLHFFAACNMSDIRPCQILPSALYTNSISQKRNVINEVQLEGKKSTRKETNCNICGTTTSKGLRMTW